MMRSATTAMCSSAMSTSSTANSSPPSRAAVSAVRSDAAQAIGGRDEHGVAGLVPVGVVDRLEVVEVDVEHDRVALAALERVLDAVHEQQPVGEAR